MSGTDQKSGGSGRGPMRGLDYAAVVCVAIAFRLVFLSAFAATPYFHFPIGYAEYYTDEAYGVLDGNGLGNEASLFKTSPLYIYFLAGLLGATGDSHATVRILQSLLGVLTALLIAAAASRAGGRTGGAASSAPTPDAASRAGGRTAGLAAGIFAALYGPAVFHEADLLPSGLSLFAIAAVIYFRARFDESPKMRWAVACGAACGAAALCSPIYLVVGAGLALLIFFRREPIGERAKFAAALAAVAAMTVAPITIRNAFVTGEFIPVSSNAGFNFFVGNNAAASGAFSMPPQLTGNDQYEVSKRVAERAAGKALGPREASAYWRGLGLKFLRENPAGAARLWLRKALMATGAQEVENSQNYEYFRKRLPALKYDPAHFRLLFMAALPALWLARKRPGLPAACAVMAGAVFATMIAFFVADRFRVLAMPPLAVMAGLTLAETYSAIRSRSMKPLAAWILAGAALLLTFASPYRNDETRMANLRGCVEYTLAVRAAERGDAKTEAERLERAEQAFRQVLDHRPDNYYAAVNLAAIYKRMGRPELAAPFEEMMRKSSAGQSAALGEVAPFLNPP